MEVALRIGPWVHGESRNGGFPDWLLQKNIPLRCNHPEYLRLVRRYFEHIAAQLTGLFWGEGGNIVAIQIENELPDQPEHLAELKRMTIELGMVAPLYTVTGWSGASGTRIPVREFLPMFGGYCDAPWATGTEVLPPSVHYRFCRMRNDCAIGADLADRDGSKDSWELPYEQYPFATCELGGGLQSTYHRRYIIRGMDIYAIALTKLGCGNNFQGYYMYHGGTNPLGENATLQESKASGYPNDVPILSYDFQAPISEYGEVREQYSRLQLLHLFLHDFQEMLAPMTPVDAVLPEAGRKDDALRCMLRTDGAGGFLFVNHYQRLYPLRDVSGVRWRACGLELPPVDLVGETAFILPLKLRLKADLRLDYALAQLLCREGEVFFFLELPGMRPEFCFDDGTVMVPKADGRLVRHGGIGIVLLSLSMALGLRRLGGQLWLASDCSLYQEDGVVRTVQPGLWKAFRWTGTAWEQEHVGEPFTPAELRLTPVAEAPGAIVYPEELELGGGRPRRYFRLEVSSGEGFVEIRQAFDVAQIYADGQLVADQFYCGIPWRIPARLLFGKKCFLVQTDESRQVYCEYARQ